MPVRGLLERLNDGDVIIGDGGLLFCLEKLGYVRAGDWSPEVTIENPTAVLELHKEFMRAGADVIQTFTFFSSVTKDDGISQDSQAINDAAIRLAKQAADNKCLVGGNISGSVNYMDDSYTRKDIIAQFVNQRDNLLKHGVDFFIIEMVEFIQEMEWAIEVCKKGNLPIVACMTMGPQGDCSGISTADCALRMAKAGADVIGTNCRFGPDESLSTIKIMKDTLEKAKIKKYFISQPAAYHTPDVGRLGLAAHPEYPFALEPRLCTRFEIQKWAREAYKLGVRYLGGCCGYEPYHIRSIAEEFATERGGLPVASGKSGIWGKSLSVSNQPWLLDRSKKDYWINLIPATGRAYSPCFGRPDPRSTALKSHKYLFANTESGDIPINFDRVANPHITGLHSTCKFHRNELLETAVKEVSSAQI